MKLNCRELSTEELESFVSEVLKIAKQSGLVFATCAEAIDLEKYNIQHNSCIDRVLIERITGSSLKVNRDGQRTNCDSQTSVDDLNELTRAFLNPDGYEYERYDHVTENTIKKYANHIHPSYDNIHDMIKICTE